jgi:hypothetical protein
LKVWAKSVLDILLECCKCIWESKEHDQRFREAIVGMYGCLPDVFILYPDKAVSIANVDFGDVFHLG